VPATKESTTPHKKQFLSYFLIPWLGMRMTACTNPLTHTMPRHTYTDTQKNTHFTIHTHKHRSLSMHCTYLHPTTPCWMYTVWRGSPNPELANFCIRRVGQNRKYTYTLYTYPHIYTACDRIFGDFPAINTVYTPYLYGSGQPLGILH